MQIRERARNKLSLDLFKNADQQMIGWSANIKCPEEQYILRMCIKAPWTNGFVIPTELEWIREIVEYTHWSQKMNFIDHPFVYITVRSGVVKSTTDDEWHVDGFSMRKEHLPEQNYIWSDHTPTEILEQNFDFPADFDPMKHNVHHFFEDNQDVTKIRQLKPKTLYVIDPYIVHRRPKIEAGVHRSFFRISYIPIEIEDDTCTQNPLLPSKVYGRTDIRKTLTRY